MSCDPILFREIEPPQRRELASKFQDGLNVAFRESRNAAWELAKFLFAANTGAAAGLFIMVQRSPGDPWLITSCFTFCLGVVLVGVAYFGGARHFHRCAVEYEMDVDRFLRDELSLQETVTRNRQRAHGGWSQWVPVIGMLSLGCLILGGVAAAKPFLVQQ